jgi:hypothetical protein
MDINELKTRKRQLEESIAARINCELEQFEKETGIRPNDISLNMIEIQDLGLRDPRFRVQDIKLHIEI